MATSLIVPSEFETRFDATTLTLPPAATSSSASSRTSPLSSSGSMRKSAPILLAMYCQGT